MCLFFLWICLAFYPIYFNGGYLLLFRNGVLGNAWIPFLFFLSIFLKCGVSFPNFSLDLLRQFVANFISFSYLFIYVYVRPQLGGGGQLSYTWFSNLIKISFYFMILNKLIIIFILIKIFIITKHEEKKKLRVFSSGGSIPLNSLLKAIF